jgi:acetyl esterase/lipase
MGKLLRTTQVRQRLGIWVLFFFSLLAEAKEKPKVETFFYGQEKPNFGESGQAQSLDLYLPAQGKLGSPTKGYPLLFFIHGGAWISDDKSGYAGLASGFNKEGFAVAIPNYRLSGKGLPTHHPDHIRDCHTALAYVVHEAAKWGLRKDRFFVMGHSAGAFLSALIAFDRRYGEIFPGIKGYIGLEGIYDLPELAQKWPAYPEWFLSPAFGSNRSPWKDFSPQYLPLDNKAPWLVVHSVDDELVDLAQSQKFFDRLKNSGVPAQFYKATQKSHDEVVKSLFEPHDFTTKEILRFLKE